jgi:HEAT repeat protein
MMELARSDNGRARNAAAIFFGLSDDGRAPEELRRLFNDESAMVRSRALRFYAAHIHPQSRQGNVWGIGEPAETVPEGVEAMLPLVSDANVKVQLDAVSALSAYAGLDHARILEALHQALSDPKHKVQHAAARSLGVPCPKCDGGSPEPKQPSQVPVVQ